MSGSVFDQPEEARGVAPVDAEVTLPGVPIHVMAIPEGIVVAADRAPDCRDAYLSNAVLLI